MGRPVRKVPRRPRQPLRGCCFVSESDLVISTASRSLQHIVLRSLASFHLSSRPSFVETTDSDLIPVAIGFEFGFEFGFGFGLHR